MIDQGAGIALVAVGTHVCPAQCVDQDEEDVDVVPILQLLDVGDGSPGSRVGAGLEVEDADQEGPEYEYCGNDVEPLRIENFTEHGKRLAKCCAKAILLARCVLRTRRTLGWGTSAHARRPR